MSILKVEKTNNMRNLWHLSKPKYIEAARLENLTLKALIAPWSPRNQRVTTSAHITALTMKSLLVSGKTSVHDHREFCFQINKAVHIQSSVLFGYQPRVQQRVLNENRHPMLFIFQKIHKIQSHNRVKQPSVFNTFRHSFTIKPITTSCASQQYFPTHKHLHTSKTSWHQGKLAPGWPIKNLSCCFPDGDAADQRELPNLQSHSRKFCSFQRGSL